MKHIDQQHTKLVTFLIFVIDSRLFAIYIAVKRQNIVILKWTIRVVVVHRVVHVCVHFSSNLILQYNQVVGCRQMSLNSSSLLAYFSHHHHQSLLVTDLDDLIRSMHCCCFVIDNDGKSKDEDGWKDARRWHFGGERRRKRSIGCNWKTDDANRIEREDDGESNLSR